MRKLFQTRAWVLPMAICLLAAPVAAQSTSQYNYAEALQKSIYFYEAQRSGPLPQGNRVFWRANSALKDGADNNVDLTGGWYDAGDHVKFGFPMASSATLLAWGALEYRAGYQDSQQMAPLLSSLRWVSDYFLKASATPNQLWGQVGDGNADHAFWGAAEILTMPRPSFKVSEQCPGSDLAGETAAALAAASMVFRAEGDPAYAQKLLDRAQSLFTFADTYRGQYSDCIENAKAFYQSHNGYIDELAWSATWLYRATGNAEYLTKATAFYSQLPLEAGTQFKSYAWTHNWDDKSYGTYVLLSQVTGKPDYRADIERWLDFWTIGFQGRRIRYTPGGLAWLDQWGSLRYSANTSFLAMIYSDWLRAKGLDASRADRYRAFAERQVNYMLGENPRRASYVAGFGQQPPRNPHHRTAHGSWADDINAPQDSVHTLYGALVGGPDASDNYTDSRTDFVKNEVATDYNAAFTGALAAMFQRYGGTPLADFPQPVTPSREELFVEAAVNASGENFIEIAAFAANQTAWPARATDSLTLRYFFAVPSENPDDITVSTGFSQCESPGAPQMWSIQMYYVEIRCGPLAPAGQQAYRRQTQFRIASRTPRRPESDWSFSGMTIPSSGFIRARQITLYENGRLVWGQEPPGGVPQVLRIVNGETLPAATAGEGYQYRWQASGGAPPYLKWEVSAGSLRERLLLDSATGVLSGIPEKPGDSTFTVRVTDSRQAVAEKEFRLATNAAAPLLVTTRTLRSAYIGTPYSATLEASGGVQPYHWAIVEGALPQGFSLLSNTITGNTTTGGDFSITVEVTDGLGAKSRRAFVLNVTAVPVTEGLKLYYRANFPEAVANQSGPQFRLLNAGSATVPFEELKVFYYFNSAESKPLNLWCDYSAIGCENVKGRFVDAGSGMRLLEVSFTGSAAIAPGADSGEVQLRFAQDDWSNFSQSDDYSFDPSKRSYAEWDRMTVYRNGVLVWGVPPAGLSGSAGSAPNSLTGGSFTGR
ncbi:MAG: glycoside hydrolase family 9 protein [Acidobacteriota bacterium]